MKTHATMGAAVIGPDAIWNPFSTDSAFGEIGRVVRDALEKRAREQAAQLEADALWLEQQAEAAAKAAGQTVIDTVTPNLLPATIAALGAPTWGYWAPDVLAGAGVIAGVAGAAIVFYKYHQKGKRR